MTLLIFVAMTACNTQDRTGKFHTQDTMDAIFARTSIRSYQPQAVEEEKIELLRNATAGDATCEELTRFFSLLLENKREKMMVFILHSYLYLYRKKKRI